MVHELYLNIAILKQQTEGSEEYFESDSVYQILTENHRNLGLEES